MIFGADQLHEIHMEAIRLGLQNKRAEMLLGMNADYVSSLRQVANPDGQLLSDLDSMNNIGTSFRGVALERWFRNAAHATRMFLNKKEFFNELADEVIRRVLPAPLAILYQPIKSNFEIIELKRILMHDLQRDSTNYSLLRSSEDSVLCLLQEAEKQGQFEDFLGALRNARSENVPFVAIANSVLNELNAKAGSREYEVLLPPCDDCWWRTTSDLHDMARCFGQHISDIRTDAGLPDVTDGLIDHLTRETPNLAFGAALVEATNNLLRKTFDSTVKGRLITTDFESTYIENAWSRVFVEADAKGNPTLVALFLALFLKGGVISSIADTNLRMLLDATANHD